VGICTLPLRTVQAITPSERLQSSHAEPINAPPADTFPTRIHRQVQWQRRPQPQPTTRRPRSHGSALYHQTDSVQMPPPFLSTC